MHKYVWNNEGIYTKMSIVLLPEGAIREKI